MKRIFVAILCVVVMGLNAETVVAGQVENEELCIPLGTITISPPDGVDFKRSPVAFPHSLHFDYNCKQCHHDWTGDTEDLNCTTSDCHDSPTSLLKTDKSDAYRYYKTAYHTQCIGCHKGIKKANEELEMSKKEIKGTLPETGPTGCIDCHPKE